MSLNIQQFTVNLFGESTYVVYDDESRQAMIVDAGMTKPYEEAEVDDFIAAKQLQLKYMVNTHLHLDHTFGNRHIEDRYRLSTMAHAADFGLGRDIAGQAAMFHLRGQFFSPTKLVSIDETTRLRLGNDELHVLHVPGHTPGGVAFYAPKSGFVISGDALFAGSIGRADLPGGDYAQLIRSIQTKLLTLPPNTVVYPGHGPATAIGLEMSQNPYL